jgi:glycosyltransferase involved in cell wall biosynthesis
MKIGIDASLVVGEKAGVGWSTANLIEALARVDHQNQYSLYPFFYHIFDPRFKELVAPARNFSVRFKALPEAWIRHLWFESRIPRHRLLGKVDVLHSTTFCCPPVHSGKLVVTIYDISFVNYPECHTEANRIHCLNGTLESSMEADRIIAISQNTKKDLVEYFNVQEDRIAVIPLAAREEFHPRPMEEVKAFVAKRWGLDKPYLLSVGTVEPRKNLRHVIQVYCALPEELRNQYPLVIAGGGGWLSSDIYRWILKMGAESSIHFLGYVLHDLPWLYCGAACFVYPSLYEGFGMPPLEAMACGIPVITSNTSSLPEVVGDAALLVDPQSEEELRSAIIKVTSDPTLRQSMSEKGLDQAKIFSWEQIARDTLKVYETC